MRNSHVLLIVDNCSAYSSPETLSILSNTEVLFLPPSCTSMLQSCGAGTVAALKLRNHVLSLERALGMVEEIESIHMCKVNVLTAMEGFLKTYNLLPADVILSCWRRTGLSGVTNVSSTDVMDPSALREREEEQCLLKQMVSRKVINFVEAILNAGDENRCIEEAIDEVLIQHVLPGIDNHHHSESVPASNENYTPLPPLK